MEAASFTGSARAASERPLPALCQIDAVMLASSSTYQSCGTAGWTALADSVTSTTFRRLDADAGQLMARGGHSAERADVLPVVVRKSQRQGAFRLRDLLAPKE